MKRHVHGGRVFEAALELGMRWEDILDFSANINPLGQAPGLKERLFDCFGATIHYPDPDASSLVRLIARESGLPEECILPGAGSTPHIRMLVRNVRPQRPAIIVPAFAEYEESLHAVMGEGPGAREGPGADVRHLRTEASDGFLVTEKTLLGLRALGPDLIFMANPANPTGRLVPESVLDRIISYSDEEGVTLALDEAFIDFTERPSVQARVMGHPKLVVLRSLTKIFAIPGLRLAYLAAHPDTIRALKPSLEPWPLNAMALEAGIWSVPQRDFLLRTKAETARLRTLLNDTLAPYGELCPSDCNFALLRLGKGNAGDLLASLRGKGILVRDCANFVGLEEGYLRFAVRPEREILALGKALSEALPGPGVAAADMPRGSFGVSRA
ncbi:MAG: aminotransferase class I/II-fold pyridoxal phosphate-dependent enzyme [Deltaproteobacteria bacterium]|jgi:threonine-phosphate decarboxylase|nr:aminotransferase class I/II-fold pyridoxal phosphate-dependent enzyme [Deltaproteobacteria bacterium]